MAWTSTTPEAIDNLMGALRAAPELSGVAVIDGPTVSGQTIMEAVTVGYVGPEDNTSVEGSLAGEGLAVAPSRERYTIRCACWVLDGAGRIGTARRRAYDLLSAAGGALAADHTLSGLVLRASIGDVALAQEQTSKGAAATVAFSVDIDAFTQ